MSGGESGGNEKAGEGRNGREVIGMGGEGEGGDWRGGGDEQQPWSIALNVLPLLSRRESRAHSIAEQSPAREIAISSSEIGSASFVGWGGLEGA